MTEETIKEPAEETNDEPQLIWWLASVDIVYRKGGLEKIRPVNVIFTTGQPMITERVLGNINVSAQKQAMNRKLLPDNAVIVDCINRGFSMLGVMSEKQFRDRPVALNEQG